MSTQVVEFVKTELDTTLAYLPEQFEFRREKGWHWLQRIALWMLRKIGAFAVVKNTTIRRYRVDSRSFIEAIQRQRAEIMTLYHQRGERLLIGPDEWQKLMGDEINTSISMQLRYDWQDNGVAKICGMNVTVVPWMKGVLVVPKEWR